MKYLFLLSGFLFFFNCQICCQVKSVYISPDNLPSIARLYNANLFDLKSEYFQYLFLIERNVLLKNYKNQIKDLPEKARIAFELGDINALTKNQLILKFLQIEKEINECTFDISITENMIKKLLNITDNIIPDTDTFTNYISVEVAEFIQIQMVAQPDLSLRNFLSNENLLLQFEKAESAQKYFIEHLLPYAANLERNSFSMLKNEEIDKIDYYEMLSDVFQIKMDFLKVVNEFNMIILQIEKNHEK